MREYTYPPTDLKTLIGEPAYPGHIHQQQEQELREAIASDNEPLVCYFCKTEIRPDEPVNLHHTTYKSRGGTHVEPAHEKCHVEFHSRQGDFRAWGRQSAETRRWAFNLRNVRDNPAFDFDRQYYLALYAR